MTIHEQHVATARTVSGFVGMIFRRPTVLQLPAPAPPLHPVLTAFVNDVDLLGTTLDHYAKHLVTEIVSVGRGGTLVDWRGDAENRTYLSRYSAESILNWRETRIAGISASVTASLNSVLRWVYWWHSTEARPEDVTAAHLRYELNTDFDSAMLTPAEIHALVAAWQSGASSRDTLLHNLRTGEILPPARTNEQEVELIREEGPQVNPAP